MCASKRMLCLAIAIAVVSAGYVQAAGKASEWIKDEATVDGSGTIYLGTTFGHKSGTFDATPESVTDNRTSISGDFLVGTYRIVSNPASPNMQDNDGRAYDELVSTELIDCANGFAGTLRTVEKLHGKVMRDASKQDKDVMMVQTHDITTDSKLCQLHQGKGRSTFRGPDSVNPDYRPGTPSAADIDKLIDKDTSSSGGKPL